MKSILFLLLCLPFLLLAACAGAGDDTAVSTVSGPALLMFYTDN